MEVCEVEVWRYDGANDSDEDFSELVRLRQAVFAQLKPLCPAFGDIIMSQIHQNLSQKAFVFGEQTSAVLHRNIQSPSVELDEGNAELKRLVVNWV